MGACAVAGVAVSLAVSGAASPPTGTRAAVEAYNLAATVFTLEGGIVGTQTAVHFTPLQLQGYYCRYPNTCVPVDYPAYPGDQYIQIGADRVIQAISTVPANTQIILMGHSEGAQVIDAVLRRWATNPSTAPSPTSVSWVALGDPTNVYGGQQTKLGVPPTIPVNTAYKGLEVIRQYDGWADWPDNPFNGLAIANAIAGMATIHPDYTSVDINSPQNVRYTPPLANGAPGNITYVWVPTAVMPLVAGYGPLAPMMDRLLRPIVESAYNRPVQIPMPGAAVQPAATQTAVQSVDVASAPAVQNLSVNTVAAPSPAESVNSSVTGASAPGDSPTRSSVSVASTTESETEAASGTTDAVTSNDSEPAAVRHRPGRSAWAPRSAHAPSWPGKVSQPKAAGADTTSKTAAADSDTADNDTAPSGNTD